MEYKRIEDLSMKELTDERDSLQKYIDDNCSAKNVDEGVKNPEGKKDCLEKRKRLRQLQAEFTSRNPI